MFVAIVTLVLMQPSHLERGVAALERYRLEAARNLLAAAADEGPYPLEQHVLLYEGLGMVHAYLDESERSLAAFDMLLTLDPGHALSYTLSPKVTFQFEEARARARGRPSPAIDVCWPRNREVDEPLPLTLEVVADPKHYLKGARLYWRLEGTDSYQQIDLDLPEPGAFLIHELAPLAPGATADQTVHLYLTASDARGNEVLRVGSSDQPREIRLRYAPPTFWYERWWVWGIAGAVLAGGVGTTAYLLARSPPDRVPIAADTRL